MRFFTPLLATLAVVVTLDAGLDARAADRESASEIRPRVDYHLREATLLAEHFEVFLANGCPRFDTVAEWKTYADREVDRMLLLAAHMEQAWEEAKRTGDKDVRRAAKAPRRRLDEAPQIMDKLAACAQDNGATFSAGSAYRRIERDLPRRQAEIALPR